MGHATIADVARRAGLSTATVDRVLNLRAGVSAPNRHRVLTAARDLGYLPGDGTMPLPHRPAHLEFYLPAGANSFMGDLARALTDYAASLPLVASCTVTRVDGLGPEAWARALQDVARRTIGVGVVAPDDARTCASLRHLTEAGLRVVTVASDLPGTARAAYVGVDNHAAGRTAGLMLGLMLGTRPASVAIVVGSRTFHGHRERERGVRDVLRERFPGLTVLPSIDVGEDSARSRLAALRLLQGDDPPAAIYGVGAGRAGVIEALRSVGRPRPHVVMHDLTEVTRRWLEEDLIDVIIDQNARLVAEQAVIRLLGSIASAAPFLSARDIEPRILLRENLPR